jgi:uncharacterized damage-inducible protein DinB
MKKFHIQTLDNVKEVCSLLEKENYTLQIGVLSNSSIGQHIRHIIEFYTCLLEGYSTGQINYDQRQRNVLIETLPDYAFSTIESIQAALNLSDFEKDMEVIHTIADEAYTIRTTFARELYYMAEHTLHHFALIKIGFAASFPEIQLPLNFGIADSTVKHKHAQESCAS